MPLLLALLMFSPMLSPKSPVANAVRVQLTLQGAPPLGRRGWQPGMTLDGREAQFREIASRRDVVVKALAPYGFRERSESGISDRWTIVAISETLDPAKPLPDLLLEKISRAGADRKSVVATSVFAKRRNRSSLARVHMLEAGNNP